MTRKVLLIDDDTVIRMLLSEFLESKSYEVFAFDNGHDALASMPAVRPDVAILDMQMPAMDGLTVLRKIREQTLGHSLPVIILSANNEAPRLLDRSGLSAAAVLEKPFQMDAVTRQLDKIFSLD